MKEIYQTAPKDCLRACVASLLELTSEEVPDFCAVEGDSWWDDMQAWFVQRKMFFLMVALHEKTPWFAVPSPLAIFVGFDEKAEINHAVVGRVNGGEFEAIFNPSGNGEVDWTIDSVCFLVPLDPSEAPKIYRETPTILKSGIIPARRLNGGRRF